MKFDIHVVKKKLIGKKTLILALNNISFINIYLPICNIAIHIKLKFHSFLKLSFFKPDFQFICMKTYRCFGLQTMELKRGQQQIPQVRNLPWFASPYIGIWDWFVIHFSSFSLTGCRHRCKQTELTFLPCFVSSGLGLTIVVIDRLVAKWNLKTRTI